ncbi:MAG: O-antigen ligase family protein [Muribaculaceae bacterium]|nr:O-antigen ligase family protein [Muribaculaceae bacterium]
MKDFYKPGKTDSILWLCFTLWLIIDTITGYFLNSGISFPLSQGFKILILLLLIIRIIKKGIYLKLTVFLLLYISIFIVVLSLHERAILPTFSHLTKLISTLYLYIYFCIGIDIWHSGYIYKSYKILKIAFIIVGLNIALGIFGIGFHTYPDEQVGYKGFFFAGNELGGVIVAVLPFMQYVIFKNASLKHYIIISSIILFLSVILGTKSVLIICFLTSFIVPWLLGNKKMKRRILLFAVIIGTPVLSYLILKMIQSESELFLKLAYSYNTNGILGLIFSGRDEFLLTRGSDYYNGDLFTLLFGLGENITVEMDPFDSLLNYGIIGFFTNIFIFLFLLKRAYKCKYNNTFVRILIFQNWLTLFMAIIAGHILYSSMAGLYIALTNSFALIKSKSPCLINLRKY